MELLSRGRGVVVCMLFGLMLFGLVPTAGADVVGDTVVVGYSALDNQHNTVIGRMIAYDPNGDGGNGLVHLVYTKLLLDRSDRYVVSNKVHFVDGMPDMSNSVPSTISGGYSGGYATLGMSPSMENPWPVYAFHDRPGAGQVYSAHVASESEVVPGFFIEQILNNPLGGSVTQFKIAMDADSIAHMVGGSSTGTTGDPRPLIYYRLAANRLDNTFEITNPAGSQSIVTEIAPFSAAEIAVSPDGQRVAISHILAREALGQSTVPSGSDYVLWVSDDGGRNWNFDESLVNVTQFAGPYGDLLPDTTAADGDTMRVTSGSSLFIDDDNTLHFAYEVYPWFHYEETGYIFGRVYYWNDEHQEHIQVADGSFFLNAGVTSYGSMTGKPSLYKDPDTGYLWCLYQQFGEPGDTLETGDAMDAGESTGLLNADLYIAASPPGEYNGLLWYKGVNITNTKGTTGSLPAGESQHERDASLALNNDGDYLNILYLKDLDSGNFDNGNGTITENPLIYHRVSKQELIDMYNDQQEFVRNYPIHIDSTGFWQDEEDWAWRELTSVDEPVQAAQPGGFEIEHAWPNPFNATLSVRFSLDRTSKVRLAVFDVLGREVAELSNHTYSGGRHTLSFDAQSLASGVYFLRLENGFGENSMLKVALVK
ncbi:T9SS type A sorting domain-containing protein [bacterium]|nr:T9SS type A sorting domain-containing protein [bacterium]